MKYYGLTKNQQSFIDILLSYHCVNCNFIFKELKFKSKGMVLQVARQLRYIGYPIHIYAIGKRIRYYFLEDYKNQAIDIIWKENKNKISYERLIIALFGKRRDEKYV